MSLVTDRDDFVIMIGYKAKTSNNIPKLSWEHDAYKWLTKEESLKVELPEIHKKILEKALTKN